MLGDIFSLWDLYPECIRVLYPSLYVIQQHVYILEIIEKLDTDNASHIAIGREQDDIHGSKEEVEKTNKIEWLNEPGPDLGKTDETEWEYEQIGREYWLKSHDKIKEWMGKNDERRW